MSTSTDGPFAIEGFRALIEHSSDLVSVITAEAVLRYVSPSHERLLGYKPEEMIGRSAFDFVHHDDVARVAAILSDGVERQTSTVTSEARFRHRDGSWRVLEGKATARFDDPMIRGVVVNARDVTDRKCAEQQRAADARELERQQRELQAFVYAITHELKGPINSIVLITDLLLRASEQRLDGPGRAELARVFALACSTEDLLGNLFDFVRITAVREDSIWVELEALVGRAIDKLRPQIEAKQVLVEHGELPRIWARPRQLGHAVENLIGNAVKYVSSGTGRVRISGRREEAMIVVTVADNGVGIPALYRPRIFELFRRVPDVVVDGRPVNGTGVGLAIVREVAEAHGGSVAVESSEGRGSRFEVRLPLPPEWSPHAIG